jgi:hypothetical protein
MIFDQSIAFPIEQIIFSIFSRYLALSLRIFSLAIVEERIVDAPYLSLKTFLSLLPTYRKLGDVRIFYTWDIYSLFNKHKQHSG